MHTFSSIAITLTTLTRSTLSLAMAFSALTGFIVARHALNADMIHLFAGVFLLSAAASALNQFQERHYDASMARTRHRPLPRNQITPAAALIVGATCAAAGLALLAAGTTLLAAGLGALSVIWYNAVYTPLKRVTSFAVIVGAVTGALAPVIGYVGAGGALPGKGIYIGAFMFLWQVPHFLLLLLKYGEQYHEAGFRSVSTASNVPAVKRIILAWVIAASASTGLMAYAGLITGTMLLVVLGVANAALIGYFAWAMLRRATKLHTTGLAFGFMYLFQGLVLAILIIEALTHQPVGLCAPDLRTFLEYRT